MRTETPISREEAFELIRREYPEAVEPPNDPNTTYFRIDEDGRTTGVSQRLRRERRVGGTD